MSAYLLPFSAILPGRLPPAIHSFIHLFIHSIYMAPVHCNQTATLQSQHSSASTIYPICLPLFSLSLCLSLSVFLCLSLYLPVALSFSLLQISIQTESNRPVRALSHCMPVLSLHYPIVTDVLQSYRSCCLINPTLPIMTTWYRS